MVTIQFTDVADLVAELKGRGAVARPVRVVVVSHRVPGSHPLSERHQIGVHLTARTRHELLSCFVLAIEGQLLRAEIRPQEQRETWDSWWGDANELAHRIRLYLEDAGLAVAPGIYELGLQGRLLVGVWKADPRQARKEVET